MTILPPKSDNSEDKTIDHKSNSMTDQQSNIANGKMDGGASTPRFAARADGEEATRPVVRPLWPSSGRSQHEELPVETAA